MGVWYKWLVFYRHNGWITDGNTPNASKTFSPKFLPKPKSSRFFEKSSLWVSIVREHKDNEEIWAGCNWLSYSDNGVLHDLSFPFGKKISAMVFCCQKYSDLMWERTVLVIEKNFWNSRLKAKNLQKFWDH